jgi:hypothetical protein
LENLKGRDHLEDVGVGRRIILKWIMIYGVRMRTGLKWLGMGSIGGLL